jgi:hypothetical protein
VDPATAKEREARNKAREARREAHETAYAIKEHAQLIKERWVSKSCLSMGNQGLEGRGDCILHTFRSMLSLCKKGVYRTWVLRGRCLGLYK